MTAGEVWATPEESEPHFRPTMQLRWYQSKNGRSFTLQQRWISDDATEERWLVVPTVIKG